MKYRETVINFILTIGVYPWIPINWNICVLEQVKEINWKWSDKTIIISKLNVWVFWSLLSLICLTHGILFFEKELEWSTAVSGGLWTQVMPGNYETSLRPESKAACGEALAQMGRASMRSHKDPSSCAVGVHNWLAVTGMLFIYWTLLYNVEKIHSQSYSAQTGSSVVKAKVTMKQLSQILPYCYMELLRKLSV